MTGAAVSGAERGNYKKWKCEKKRKKKKKPELRRKIIKKGENMVKLQYKERRRESVRKIQSHHGA